jgi:hypothetical protein
MGRSAWKVTDSARFQGESLLALESTYHARGMSVNANP